LSRQLDKQQPAQDNSCLAPIFKNPNPRPLPRKTPWEPGAVTGQLLVTQILAPNVGPDFFGATTNFRLSFIFIEAQSLFSIGAKGVGKGLLKVEFF
jgi:hypothetical protein